MGKALELSIAVLNGAVGDYLGRSGNGLATPMSVIVDGSPMPLERAALTRVFPDASGRLVVLVHGLMCSEDVWDFGDGSTYGTRLAEDAGLRPVVLRYNTGLSIAENGRELGLLLEHLVAAFPVPVTELVLLGYSMGGLVIRSACHQAESESSTWLPIVSRAIYVGTPHLGAPLERAARRLLALLRRIPDPVVRAVGQVADVRSRGIQDLGDAVLHAEHEGQRTRVIPLSPRFAHYLVAGSLSANTQLAEVLGDFMVPVPSGSDGHHGATVTGCLPDGHVVVLYGKSHVAMAHDRDAYEAIRGFCGAIP